MTKAIMPTAACHVPPPTVTDQEQQHTEGSYKWWVLATVVFGVFASLLDSTIVNTALPKIQTSFHASLHLVSYVATGYIMAAGVMVPLSGFLANRFGIKRVYLASLALFTVFSALCGLAPNTLILILCRILQGAGGAALFPLAFALLFDAFPEDERGKANGVFGLPVLVAPTIGPTVGGYLSQSVDWRWVFYVNIPIGLVGVLLGLRVLRAEEGHHGCRFDLPGFALAAGGLGLLLFGLSNLAYDGWASVGTVSGPIIVALVLLVLFVPVELRRAEPLVDLRLYRRRTYTLSTIIAVLASIGLFGPGFLLPQYLQDLRGLTPTAAGLLLLWGGVGALAATVVSGWLYNRLGPPLLIIAGAVLMALTGYLLARWSTATSALALLPWLLLVRGIGTPFVMQTTGTAGLAGIRGRVLPSATTLNVVTRNVTASLSIALLTTLLQGRTVTHVAALGRRAARGAAQPVGPGAHVSAAVRAAQALAYHDIYLIVALVVVPVLVLGYFVRPARRLPRTQEAPRPVAASTRDEARGAVAR